MPCSLCRPWETLDVCVPLILTLIAYVHAQHPAWDKSC